MTNKNDKRLCWNCDGSVSLHLSQCPYCGVDLSAPPSSPFGESRTPYANPFQQAPQETFENPFHKEQEQHAPPPPFGNLQEFGVSDEEWKSSLNEQAQEREEPAGSKKEMGALLLLLPGVVFFLFGLMLLLFSEDGVLSLSWSQRFAYFYFVGAAPLLFLGWRSLR